MSWEEKIQIEHAEQQARFLKKDKTDFNWMVDNCELFNSERHWWVYWHKETDRVFDQYGYYLSNADFLRSEGLIETPKALSLNPTPSMKFYCELRQRHKDYQRTARIKGKVKMTFEHWAKNNNIDLTGKTKVKNPYLDE